MAGIPKGAAVGHLAWPILCVPPSSQAAAGCQRYLEISPLGALHRHLFANGPSISAPAPVSVSLHVLRCSNKISTQMHSLLCISCPEGNNTTTTPPPPPRLVRACGSGTCHTSAKTAVGGGQAISLSLCSEDAILGIGLKRFTIKATIV